MFVLGAQFAFLLGLGALASDPYIVMDEAYGWEVVFNREAAKCNDLDETDSMPVAYVSRTTKETFLVFSDSMGIFPNVGSNLNDVKHDCDRVVFNSTFDLNPQSFANHQWLQSVVSFAENDTMVGFAHNEFHGFAQVPKYCSKDNGGGSCNMWSTGMVVSNDGGQTFHNMYAPPQHRVASSPYVYVPDQTTFGYGAVSSVHLDETTSHYYGFINIFGSHNQSGGICPFRTNNLFDPSALRVWNATTKSYSTTLIDPYTASDPNLHLCDTLFQSEPVHPSSHPNPRKIISPSIPFPPYVMSGDGIGENFTISYRFSNGTTPDSAFTNWGEPRFFSAYDLNRYGYRILYPTFLDPTSPSMGSDTFGYISPNNTYIYVNIGRNILRHKIRFSSSPPPPPPPPLPPNPDTCSVLNVSEAALATANGIYSQSNRSSDNVPVFVNANNVDIYRFDGAWRIGVESVEVYYLAHGYNQTRPPPQNWSPENAPFPSPASVLCVK